MIGELSFPLPQSARPSAAGGGRQAADSGVRPGPAVLGHTRVPACAVAPEWHGRSFSHGGCVPSVTR